MSEKSKIVRRSSTVQPKVEEVDILEEYRVIKDLGTGRFSFITLVEDIKAGNKRVSLKQFRKDSINKLDFFREYNYSVFLCPHPNIMVAYQGVYSTPSTYFFAQEYTPFGSLRDVVYKTSTGLGEEPVKRMLVQVAKALEFMHKEGLVHRNLQAKNVLLFDRNMDWVKLTDLGLTRKEGAMVKNFEKTHEYHAPELCDTLIKEAYSVDRKVDVWAFGILIYFALKGRYPWEKATIMFKPYWEWEEWMKGKKPQLPQRWSRFSERLLKFFRKSLKVNPEDRCSISDIHKYIKPKWLKDTKSASEEDLSVTESHSAKDVHSLTVKGQNLYHSSSAEHIHKDCSSLKAAEKKKRSIFHNFLANTLQVIAK